MNAFDFAITLNVAWLTGPKLPDIPLNGVIEVDKYNEKLSFVIEVIDLQLLHCVVINVIYTII